LGVKLGDDIGPLLGPTLRIEQEAVGRWFYDARRAAGFEGHHGKTELSGLVEDDGGTLCAARQHQDMAVLEQRPERGFPIRGRFADEPLQGHVCEIRHVLAGLAPGDDQVRLEPALVEERDDFLGEVDPLPVPIHTGAEHLYRVAHGVHALPYDRLQSKLRGRDLEVASEGDDPDPVLRDLVIGPRALGRPFGTHEDQIAPVQGPCLGIVAVPDGARAQVAKLRIVIQQILERAVGPHRDGERRLQM
jgi:hypothetical protein